jgi:hypothetical protein
LWPRTLSAEDAVSDRVYSADSAASWVKNSRKALIRGELASSGRQTK